jgi:hypothetical protein
LEKEIAYFTKRLDMMDYGKLKKKDLVIASGQVEGAVRYRDGRIKAHVFLCMLSYYIQWHMKQSNCLTVTPFLTFTS